MEKDKIQRERDDWREESKASAHKHELERKHNVDALEELEQLRYQVCRAPQHYAYASESQAKISWQDCSLTQDAAQRERR